MKEHNIKFLLVQINEAHDAKWPAGLIDTPNPQVSFEDRLERANKFVTDHQNEYDQDVIIVKVDGFDNKFENKFRLWPDEYYLIDSNYKVLAKSEYGDKGDALINVDCIDRINHIINITN